VNCHAFRLDRSDENGQALIAFLKTFLSLLGVVETNLGSVMADEISIVARTTRSLVRFLAGRRQLQ
jgi:hypothetical protein